MAATPVTTDRVRKLAIRPYDQVFALTQYIINKGMEENWVRLCVKDPNLQKPFSAGIENFILTKAKLDYPRIIVEAHYQEALSGVVYMMCFNSGSFKLETNKLLPNGDLEFDDDGEPIKNKVEGDLTGWKIAFAMQLGLTVDERRSDDFTRIVLKAGEYSLNQLQAKFETAIFNPELSIYGTKTWNDFEVDVQDGLIYSFNKLRKNLLSRMQDARELGSILKSNTVLDPKVPTMTFEPYQIHYQTYPWVDPNHMGDFQPSSGLNGNQRLNYMLYSETTNGKDLPAVDSRMLKRNGNWTDGRLEASANSENTQFGAFHMARENFLEQYLLRKLRALNHDMEPWGTYNRVVLKDVFKIIPNWDSDLAIGTRKDINKDSPFYDFKRQSDTSWTFQSSIKMPESRDESGKDGWSGEAWANSSARVLNGVEFTPGQDVIRVWGITSFEYRYKFVDKHILRTDDVHLKNLVFNIKWTMDLDLEAVSDGGLQIKTTFTEPVIEYTDQSLSSEFPKAQSLRDDVAKAVKKTEELKKALAQDLASKHGLVLPAAGVFFFKNPILNWRGDLICEVAYSTLNPEKALNPDDQTPVNKDTTKHRLQFET